MEEQNNIIDNDIISTIIEIFNKFLKYPSEFNTFLYEIKKILHLNNKFEAEEIKIDNLDDYDDTNLYYTKLLKNLNNELPNIIAYDFVLNKSLRIYYIIFIIKILLKIIKINPSNLYEDMIKFYISNIFAFFYNDNPLALCNEYSFYKAAIYNLNKKYILNFDSEISNKKEENKFLEKIPFQIEKVHYLQFLARFNSILKQICESLIKAEKELKNEEVYKLYNILPTLNNNSKELLNLNFNIDNDLSYQNLFDKYGFTSIINDINCILNNNKNFEIYQKNFEKILKIIDKMKNWKFFELFKLFIMIGNIKVKFDDQVNEFERILDTFDKYKLSFNEKDNELNAIFHSILNDNEFKNLYIQIMKSEIIKSFVITKNGLYSNLEQYYHKFLEDYLNENNFIFKYIILQPLSLYKKAVLTPFLRIYLNDNFILKSNNLSEGDIKIILKAYLIEILIHESFHFIRRVYCLGSPSKYLISTKSDDINEKEIGKDLIYFIFQVKQIDKIDLKSAKLIIDIENWNIIGNQIFKNLFKKEIAQDQIDNEQKYLRFLEINPLEDEKGMELEDLINRY